VLPVEPNYFLSYCLLFGLHKNMYAIELFPKRNKEFDKSLAPCSCVVLASLFHIINMGVRMGEPMEGNAHWIMHLYAKNNTFWCFFYHYSAIFYLKTVLCSSLQKYFVSSKNILRTPMIIIYPTVYFYMCVCIRYFCTVIVNE